MRVSKWLLLVAASLATACANTGSTKPTSTIAVQADSSVEEAGFVEIGGIRQWVTISGQSRRNPIVVFLHGGPGNPLSPYSRSLYDGWTKDFTVVQWDQRGAGRTFGANLGSADMPLTMDRMTRDGTEVLEYVTRRLNSRKVILVGGSWGSALGVHIASRRPDLLHAYVGVGQLVSESANQSASIAKLRVLATAANDQPTLDAIAALGSPPWTNPRSFGQLRRLTRIYEANAVDAAPSSWWVADPAYSSAAYQAMYEAGEDYSYLQFVGRNGSGLLSEVDLAALGTRYDVPIYLVQGASDLVTTPEVSHAWFETVETTRKRYVLVQRAGHDPNERLLNAVYAVLQEIAAEPPRRRGNN